MRRPWRRAVALHLAIQGDVDGVWWAPDGYWAVWVMDGVAYTFVGDVDDLAEEICP